MSWKIGLFVGALGLAGCGGTDSGSLTTVATSEGSTGKKWTGGDRESELMHPGGDCTGCHAQRQEGPTFTVAGTVQAASHEADDCAGIAGATVEITSAMGAVTKLTTNEAGNFFTETKIAFPYTVKVVTSAGT